MQPMRVLITGPPACGKTTVIEQLCAHFKLHHVKIKDVIDDAISQMVNDFRCYCVYTYSYSISIHTILAL